MRKDTTMTTTTALSFHHRFEPAREQDHPPLLLLHGTGGDENDLVPLARLVAPGAALLSPRGKVLEGGAPRFFRRYAEGVFDQSDIRNRAAELAAFIAEAREAYGLPAPVAVGFSNGANIAADLMLLHPGMLAGAALVRAMVTLEDPPVPDLGGRKVLLLSGRLDPIVPVENAERLAASLSGVGAIVQHEVLPSGHTITPRDVELLKAWLGGL